jgi:two-component system, NtrC family, sensor kinase
MPSTTAPQTLAVRPQKVTAPRLPWLILLMVLAVASVGLLAFWDEERESRASLDDFAEQQAVLAVSVASELSERLGAIQRDALIIADIAEQGQRPPVALLQGYTSYSLRAAGEAPAPLGDGSVRLSVPAQGGRAVDLIVAPAVLLQRVMRLEQPSSVRLLVLGPQDGQLHGTDGRLHESDAILKGLASNESSEWLCKKDALDLGLPPRRAAAGLAQVDAGPLGHWGVAVVSSAQRERDREQRARYRVALSVLLAAGLVFAFGSLALRKQRRGLLLERELALTDLQRERDTRLAAASRAATMGTLAMGIAHEVGTPLGIIFGRAEQLLPRLAGDERSTRSLTAVMEQTDRIRRVVEGFLQLARGVTPALGDVPPERVLEGAVALVEHRFAGAGVALHVDAPGDLPPIHCDTHMLEQALVNLLLNACDACKQGGHVDAEVRSDGDRVAFTVIDDGAGIAPEDAARATEPFFTTKAPGHGTGIGLAIANEIVKMHRGSLDVQPASPRGTRASVILPAPRSEAHGPA